MSDSKPDRWEVERFQAECDAMMADDEAAGIDRAEEDLKAFNAGLEKGAETMPGVLGPEMLATIAMKISLGCDAVTAWLTGSAPEERDGLKCALRDYVAIAPPAHRELVARAVARAAMDAVRRSPEHEPFTLEDEQDELDRFNAGLLAQPVPEDMEPEEPPKPTPEG